MIKVGYGSGCLSPRRAYEELNLMNEIKKSLGDNQNVIETLEDKIVKMKRYIRKYHKEDVNNRRIVQDRGIDGYVVLIYLPDWIKTKEEAEDWFEVNEYMECPNSPYDCTGALFTGWHYIAKRNGRWELWHCICADV